jgi:ATP-dependent protease HslVU (ClpYQ) peptidase subunit
VVVRDSLTAVVWWARRSPEQFYQIAYNLVVMPEHVLGTVPRGELLASEYARRPIGSGGSACASGASASASSWSPTARTIAAARASTASSGRSCPIRRRRR